MLLILEQIKDYALPPSLPGLAYALPVGVVMVIPLLGFSIYLSVRIVRPH